MKNRVLEFLLLIIASIVTSLAFYYNILGNKLFDLNGRQWDMSGDGFKNYFNFAYHYNHGEGLQHYGTLYPYGDLLIYSDAQPAILLFFKALKWIGINLEGHELFIIQFLPILSSIIAIIFFAFLFKKRDVSIIYAFVFSVLIVFLSPQMYRMQSHYSLCYVCLFPMAWYFYERIQSTNYLKIVLLILFWVVLGFIHPYNILIHVMFFSAVGLVVIIKERKISFKSISPVVAIGLYILIVNILDPITDRPENPLGLSIYKTEVSDLFPFYGWFNDVFSKPLMLRDTFYEGYCYLGLLIFAIPFLPLLWKNEKTESKTLLSNFLIASLLCLAFGMGVHLLFGERLIYDLLPQLNQFRTLGRFSWPFYYVGLFSVLYLLHKKVPQPYKIIFLLLISGVYIIDILDYHKTIKQNIDTYGSHNLLTDKFKLHQNLLQSQDFDAKDYQAIFVLPTGSEGLEKLSLKTDWHAKISSLRLAQRLGLPSMNVLSSRISLEQGLKIVQMASSEYSPKPLIQDLNSNKHLLGIVNKSDKKTFDHILSKGFKLTEDKDVEIYQLHIDSLGSTKQPVLDTSSFRIINDHSFIDSIPLFYNSFETEANHKGLFSNHAVEITEGYVLFEEEIKSHPDTLVFSVWYKIDAADTNIPNFQIACTNEAGQVIQHHTFRDIDNKKLEVIDDWVGLSHFMTLPKETHKIKWVANGHKIKMDHVLVRPIGLNIRKDLLQSKCVNNQYICNQN